MHFFAKIFLCGTIVLSMTFLFSGYYFMNYSFEENLEKEKNLVISQYQYDKFTIQTRLLSDENLYEELLQKNSKVTLQRLLEDVEAVSAFYSDNKKVLYSKIQNINKSFIKELSDSTQNYKYYQEEDRYYLLIGSMIDQNHRFYFITKTDISGVLEQQKSLQKQFYKIYGIALGTGVILLFILSVIVTVPLKKITEAANRMAGGSYSERIHIRGNDEIGKLSRSFNVMANAVEDRMKELSEQSERKEEFVENFAHELKTPLTSVIGYADMIYQRDMSRKEIKEAAWFIWNEGMHLEALSHKLMDLTILNKQKFMLWDMGAEEVLGEILKSLQPVLKKNNVIIETKIENAYIKAEYDLLKMLLFNLIDNAIKADADFIKMSGTIKEERYEIAIEDNGAGLAEEELDKVTEPFYMVDKSRSRRKHGAGLGLALAAKIVEIHGNRLYFESEQGKGCRVSFFIMCQKGGEKDEK
ncbi:MAG: HAMP domain-containing protein [Eubacterium sp.]|jgi:signal transduction histidine kinase|nr:HAMP domain-containing protein [Eubacterium sp.]